MVRDVCNSISLRVVLAESPSQDDDFLRSFFLRQLRLRIRETREHASREENRGRLGESRQKKMESLEEKAMDHGCEREDKERRMNRKIKNLEQNIEKMQVQVT